ncbi:MAG: endo-alpha-N-acetylgalactosaminidase family protein [Puia sp.]|nr:endo-alpha-N-acetylgalactosaminidase family protein [Puia sp.]
MFIGLVGWAACGRQGSSSGVLLENDRLKVELAADLPLVRSYTCKQSGFVFSGDSGSTGWAVNGHFYPWREWKISADGEVDKRVYHLSLPALGLGFDYTLALWKEGLAIGLSHISDPAGRLKELSWGDRLLLNTSDSSFRWWARQTGIGKSWEPKKSDNRGLWNYDENRGRAGDSVPALSTVDACLWSRRGSGMENDKREENDKGSGNDDRSDNGNGNGNDKGDGRDAGILAALTSNVDFLPVKMAGGPGHGFSLGLNTWRYRLAGQTMPLLSANLLFLGDLNHDGVVSDHDYFLWKNRHLPDAPVTIRGSISYKIFMDEPTAKDPVTTMDQLDKIVTAIYHITDGLPQIAYLVGWQYHGHDTGYPSFDQWNERLGSRAGVYERSAYYRSHLNTCLSYHINIDDAYRSNKGFDTAIMATDFDGGPMFWQMFHSDTAFHISHTKDLQTGSIFKRLDALFKTVPVRQVVHIDAMRTINCNPVWEKDSLGVAEELEQGLKPIMRWLRDRGIAVTTEGQNGMPHELTGVVAGVYHLDEPSEANLMIRHRKLLGGGWQEGRGRLECGLGTSLHEDLAYRKVGNNWGFTKDWGVLRERIYLGSLLYLYYQERQLVDASKKTEGWALKFDDGTTVAIDTKNDHLLVSRGDLVIARDDDRFVPLDHSIYVYSKAGGAREWMLPAAFRGRPLEVFSLTENGRTTAPDWKISGDSIRLVLKAGIPVKIVLKNSE